MALHALVAAHAALQHQRDLFLRDAGTVVFHPQQQTGATIGRTFAGFHGEQYPRTRPLERVLQQIAQQFLQVALLTIETRLRIDLEFAEHAFPGIDLFQPADDVLGAGLQRQRRREQLVSTGRRATELVTDQIVHALELFIEFRAQFGAIGAAVHPAAQHRQRGLQAVREVGEDIALTFEILAFAFDEGVDAFGQRFQLARVALAHPIRDAALHALEFVDHPAQRVQTPAQHRHLQHQQQHAHAAEIAPQRAPEHRQLVLQPRGVFQDIDGVRHFVGQIVARPHQPVTVAVGLADLAVGFHVLQRPFEAFLARLEHAHLRQLRPARGIGVPQHEGQHDLGVQPAARTLEPRVGELVVVGRDQVAAAAELGLAGEIQRVIAEPAAQDVFGGAEEGAVQRITGQRQECDQAQAGRQQLSRLQRTRTPVI